MNTRELAKHLRQIANFLDARPPFTAESMFVTPSGKEATLIASFSYYDKENFLEAAKYIGSADKEYTEGNYSEFLLTAKNAPLKLRISRDKVCRKLVTYECEPLFSNEEVESLGG